MAWGAIIAWYLFLAGLSAGAFVTAYYVGKKMPEAKTLQTVGYILAPILLAIGLLLLIVDAEAGLHHPLRFFYLFSNLGSMMTIGTIILSIFIIISFFVALFTWLKKAVPEWLKVLGVVFATGTAIYTGFLIGVVNTAPLWNTSILPILFVVSAASTGMAITLVVTTFVNKEDLHKVFGMKKIHFSLMIIELILLFTMLYITNSVSVEAGLSVQALVTGEWAMLFWVGLVLVGLVLPTLMEGMELFKGGKEKASVAADGSVSIGSTVIAEVAVLVGGFLLRYLVLAAAIAVTII
ncbi:NrfD/PsrC family molybdoenzyme membrane anchor subunit [Rubeoparvulum massiliense]|uniref:NrfD/PsrC family molybdoenzyme membrane anchor subunit n=1 Tax=Rubeoparvulum massiliense TaxID=1631346 RepID=UPI00065DD26A|nr:NrfD/PsrC family molybdoenzyme membrane anchor subunit [Rubeoparvulum massiliense]